MSFAQDLAVGAEVEQQFVEFLTSLGIKCGRNTATNTKEMALYDVWDNSYRTYEVKFDRKAQSTNNVFLEHESILRSRAEYVVFKLEGDKTFYIANTEFVKYHIEEKLSPEKWGGTPKMLGSLIPLSKFKKIFKPVEEVISKKKVSQKT
jgi:hypothetical protein